ncbi:MAG: S-layer homology domain-containing protein, partial [Lachnospirales bacterium]
PDNDLVEVPDKDEVHNNDLFEVPDRDEVPNNDLVTAGRPDNDLVTAGRPDNDLVEVPDKDEVPNNDLVEVPDRDEVPNNDLVTEGRPDKDIVTEGRQDKDLVEVPDKDEVPNNYLVEVPERDELPNNDLVEVPDRDELPNNDLVEVPDRDEVPNNDLVEVPDRDEVPNNDLVEVPDRDEVPNNDLVEVPDRDEVPNNDLVEVPDRDEVPNNDLIIAERPDISTGGGDGGDGGSDEDETDNGGDGDGTDNGGDGDGTVIDNPDLEEIIDNDQEAVLRRYIPYIFGYEDDTVRSEGSISRAEVAQVAFNLYGFGYEPSVSSVDAYSDVAQDSWYATPIAFLTELDVVTGYEDGTFKPDEPITRAEMVKVLDAFDNHNDKLLFDNGASDISGHWAENAINDLMDKGLIDNYEDGTFKPDEDASRSEFCTLVNSVTDRPDTYNAVVTYPDLTDEEYWAYDEVMNASNYGMLNVSDEQLEFVKNNYDINDIDIYDLRSILYYIVGNQNN